MSNAGKQLWIKRNNLDLWCAGAYIINKEKLRKHIEYLVKEEKDRRLLVKVIAGYDRPCFPRECCNGSIFTNELPCVFAPRGYQADHFIYMIGNTYMITIPPVMSASLGNRSTFHQDHVSMHQTAFQLIEGYVEQLRKKDIEAPQFFGVV